METLVRRTMGNVLAENRQARQRRPSWFW